MERYRLGALCICLAFNLTNMAAPASTYPPSESNFKAREWVSLAKPGGDALHHHLQADEGFRLTIDYTIIIDNWGFFGQRELTGKVYLGAGRHRIQVDYFEKRGGRFLKVFITGPGLPYQPLPPSRLFRH